MLLGNRLANRMEAIFKELRFYKASTTRQTQVHVAHHMVTGKLLYIQFTSLRTTLSFTELWRCSNYSYDQLIRGLFCAGWLKEMGLYPIVQSFDASFITLMLKFSITSECGAVSLFFFARLFIVYKPGISAQRQRKSRLHRYRFSIILNHNIRFQWWLRRCDPFPVERWEVCWKPR